eukprot:GFYU01003822.1.p1 GENE.GFYU01003822.1~~GFYU01003822.1.p1  ORF type:complete len:1213 (+),score=363.15 GFYU01003822.1:225-3641(+)
MKKAAIAAVLGLAGLASANSHSSTHLHGADHGIESFAHRLHLDMHHVQAALDHFHHFDTNEDGHLGRHELRPDTEKGCFCKDVHECHTHDWKNGKPWCHVDPEHCHGHETDHCIQVTVNGCVCKDRSDCHNNEPTHGNRWCDTTDECAQSHDHCLPDTKGGCYCKNAHDCKTNPKIHGHHWCETTTKCQGHHQETWDFCDNRSAYQRMNHDHHHGISQKEFLMSVFHKDIAQEHSHNPAMTKDELFHKYPIVGKLCDHEDHGHYNHHVTYLSRHHHFIHLLEKFEDRVDCRYITEMSLVQTHLPKDKMMMEESLHQYDTFKDMCGDDFKADRAEYSSGVAEHGADNKDDTFTAADDNGDGFLSFGEMQIYTHRLNEAAGIIDGNPDADHTKHTVHGCICAHDFDCVTNKPKHGKQWCKVIDAHGIQTHEECARGWDYCEVETHNGHECKHSGDCLTNDTSGHHHRAWCETKHDGDDYCPTTTVNGCYCEDADECHTNKRKHGKRWCHTHNQCSGNGNHHWDYCAETPGQYPDPNLSHHSHGHGSHRRLGETSTKVLDAEAEVSEPREMTAEEVFEREVNMVTKLEHESMAGQVWQVFLAADDNSDYELDWEEMLAHNVRHSRNMDNLERDFNRCDLNGDGKVQFHELLHFMHRGTWHAQQFSAADKTGRGHLTKEEFEDHDAVHVGTFDKHDINKDGAISHHEWQLARNSEELHQHMVVKHEISKRRKAAKAEKKQSRKDARNAVREEEAAAAGSTTATLGRRKLEVDSCAIPLRKSADDLKCGFNPTASAIEGFFETFKGDRNWLSKQMAKPNHITMPTVGLGMNLCFVALIVEGCVERGFILGGGGAKACYDASSTMWSLNLSVEIAVNVILTIMAKEGKGVTSLDNWNNFFGECQVLAYSVGVGTPTLISFSVSAGASTLWAGGELIGVDMSIGCSVGLDILPVDFPFSAGWATANIGQFGDAYCGSISGGDDCREGIDEDYWSPDTCGCWHDDHCKHLDSDYTCFDGECDDDFENSLEPGDWSCYDDVRDQPWDAICEGPMICKQNGSSPFAVHFCQCRKHSDCHGFDDETWCDHEGECVDLIDEDDECRVRERETNSNWWRHARPCKNCCEEDTSCKRNGCNSWWSGDYDCCL